MISPTTAAAWLWIIWFAGWVVSGQMTAKTVAAPSRASQLQYSLFTWAGALLLFFHPRSLSALLRPLLSTNSGLNWFGVVLVAVGLGFAGWARFHLGRLWSGRVTLKEDHTIVRTGPYGFVRHPIYTGLVAAVIGTLLTQITVAAIAGVLLLITGLTIKIRQEEKLLTDHFGAAYDSYRAETSALIPYVW
jgi:protein-S-isoprenylcysteine O-methyltransferase Ste14